MVEWSKVLIFAIGAVPGLNPQMFNISPIRSFHGDFRTPPPFYPLSLCLPPSSNQSHTFLLEVDYLLFITFRKIKSQSTTS